MVGERAGRSQNPGYSASNAKGEERPSVEQKARGGTGEPGLQGGPRQTEGWSLKQKKHQADGDRTGAGAGDSGNWAEVCMQFSYGQVRPAERHPSFRLLPSDAALTLHVFRVLGAVFASRLVSLIKVGETPADTAPRNSLRTNPSLDITLIKEHDRAQPHSP